MSWLARSLVSSLRPDHDRSDDDDDDETSEIVADDRSHRASASASAETDGRQRPVEPGSPTRGVKDDLSELTKTLTRNFWGVASFLAPPPSQTLTDPESSTVDIGPEPTAFEGSDEEEEAGSPSFAGIRSDLAEIGGKFKSGISMLSSNKAVSEISKIASTFLPFGSDEFDDDDDDNGDEESGVDSVGVTDEVLTFVKTVSMHPKTWLDFPLVADDEYSDDFNMSDAQQKHALAIEHLAPRLAALRMELCPSHMSEGCFWKIYFVLLHPRLNNHDAEILSTPQIVQARSMLLQDLQHQTRSHKEGAATSAPLAEDVRSSPYIPVETTKITVLPLPEIETEKHPIEATEVKIVEKSVVKEDPPTRVPPADRSEPSILKYEDDGDEWLEEDTGEMGPTGASAILLGHNEDVSFSDLEDDNEESGSHATSVTAATDSPTKDESGWVQLSKRHEDTMKGSDPSSSHAKEPNDWLNVDINADG